MQGIKRVGASRSFALALCCASAAAVSVRAEPGFAGDEVGQARVEGYIYMNLRTGEVTRTPASGGQRRGDSFWRNDDTAGSCGYFMQQDLPTRDTVATGRVRFGSAVVNWGDAPAGGRVDGFDLGYATNVGVDPTGAGVAGFDLTATFLDSYDGEVDPGGTGASAIGAFLLENIPGGNGPTGTLAWVYVVDLEGSGLEFNTGSTDIDGDGLFDFAYAYSFDQNQASAKGIAGPLLVRPASLGGAGTALGSPDGLDWFNSDDFTGYAGPLWFGGGSCPARPYASTYMNLYGSVLVQEAYAFGFYHQAEGSATLEHVATPGGDVLRVSGLGAGSASSVSVDMGRSEGASLETPGPEMAVGESVVVQFLGSIDGGPPLVFASLTGTSTGVKDMHYVPDFTPLGASSFDLEIYNHGQLVARLEGVTSFNVHDPLDLPKKGFWKKLADTLIATGEFINKLIGIWESPMIVQPSGGGEYEGDEIRMFARRSLSAAVECTGFRLYTDGVGSLDIGAEGVSISGVPMSSIGDAVLVPDVDRITVAGMAPGGSDGLRFRVPDFRNIDWALDPPCFDCPGCPNGRWLDLLTRGALGGVPDHALGTLRFTATGPDWQMKADYSAVGSATKHLVVYRDGAVVQEISGFTGEIVGVSEDPPAGCGKGLAILGGQRTACYIIRWRPVLTRLTIPGHPPIMCDGLAVLAEAPSAPVGEIQEVSMRASGIPQMIISELLFTPFCEVDFTGDGIVDFSDYLEFLNFYDAGDLSVDFTGDGIVDFSDYLEFLNFYDAGC